MRDLLKFHLEINKLKRTKRYSGSPTDLGDSTADHSWKLALLVVDIIDRYNLDIDVYHSIKMALMHDICEYQGETDFDSWDVTFGIKSEQEKINFEEKAVNHLKKEFGRNDVYNIWREYENQETKESKFIRTLDKIEAMIHSIEIGGNGNEKREYGLNNQILYADEAVKNFPSLEPFLIEVKKEMIKLFQSQGHDIKEEDYL